MNEPVLKVENVSKKFCRSLKRSLWYGVMDVASELLLRYSERNRLRRHEFWALKDVSFHLHQGETMGLVGLNGAGKSTLLKLVNGLLKPDTGRITVRGRVGALIQLGVGFNPVLTGRENIYINAAVLGLTKRETDRLVDQIVDFAEIGDFINAPVQTYSSGMKVRLGFSVASHVNPEILLIDEILSVGDSSFRERSYARLTDYKRRGGSVIFVSHNSVAIESVSDRVMWLDHGKVVEMGEPAEVIQNYESKALQLSQEAEARLTHATATADSGGMRITAVECYDMSGNPKSEFDFGETFELRLHYESDADIRQPYFIIAIRKGSRHNPVISAMNMLWDDICLEELPRRGVVGCVIEAPPFSPGMYGIYLGVAAQATGTLGQKWYAPPQDCGSFMVLPNGLKGQLPGVPATHLVASIPPVIVAHSWKVNGQVLQMPKVSRLR